MESTPQTVASGQTPITIDWDYLNLGYVKEYPAADWKVTIPTDGVYGSYYAQAISATAPHPWMARLWEEFLYSDQGQLLWLKGYSHPIRFQDLSKRKVIPASMLARASVREPVLEGQVRDRRAADDGEEPDRQGVADDRSALGPALAANAVSESLRPDLAAGRRRLPPRLARDDPVLRLRARLPAHPRRQRHGPAPSRATERRLDALEHRASSSTSRTSPTTRRRSRSALITALLGGVLGLIIAYCGDHGREPALRALDLRRPSPASRRTSAASRSPSRSSRRSARSGSSPTSCATSSTGHLPQRLHPLLDDRDRDRLPLLPDPADDPRHRARDRRAAARVARSRVEPRREASSSTGGTWACPILTPVAARSVHPALRQRLCRLRDRVCADLGLDAARADRDRGLLHRQRPLEPAPRPGARLRDVRRARRDDGDLHPAPAALGPVDEVRRRRGFSPFASIVLRARRGVLPRAADRDAALQPQLEPDREVLQPGRLGLRLPRRTSSGRRSRRRSSSRSRRSRSA